LKKVYLHIGLEKTGTTAIQGFLNQNRGSLTQNFNVLFPKFEEDATAIDSNHRIAKLFIPNKNIAAHHKVVSLTAFEELLKNFEENSDFHTLILSSELFSYSTVSEIRALKVSLQNFDVTVILYLRRQDDYLESSYDQHVKQIWIHGKPPLNAEIFHNSTKLNFHQFILCWFENGFENIDLKIYNKSKEKDFIFKQFFENINISILKNETIEVKKHTTNPSLSLFHKLLITLYLPKINDEDLRRTTADLIFKHNMSFAPLLKSHSKSYYTKQFKIELLEKYEKSNIEILKMFPNSGFSKDSLFNPVKDYEKPLSINDLTKDQIMMYFFNLLLFLIKKFDNKK